MTRDLSDYCRPRSGCALGKKRAPCIAKEALISARWYERSTSIPRCRAPVRGESPPKLPPRRPAGRITAFRAGPVSTEQRMLRFVRMRAGIFVVSTAPIP